MKNAEVSNLFIFLKKVTVVYQLTIHCGFCISLRLPSLCLLFRLSLHFPPSPPLMLPERAFRSGLANLLQLSIIFSPSSSFFFFISLHFLSQSNIPSSLQASLSSFSLFSLTFSQTFSHVFFHHCHGILS